MSDVSMITEFLMCLLISTIVFGLLSSISWHSRKAELQKNARALVMTPNIWSFVFGIAEASICVYIANFSTFEAKDTSLLANEYAYDVLAVIGIVTMVRYILMDRIIFQNHNIVVFDSYKMRAISYADIKQAEQTISHYSFHSKLNVYGEKKKLLTINSSYSGFDLALEELEKRNIIISRTNLFDR